MIFLNGAYHQIEAVYYSGAQTNDSDNILAFLSQTVKIV